MEKPKAADVKAPPEKPTPAASTSPLKVKMIDPSGSVIQIVPGRFVEDMKARGYKETS